MTLFTYLGLYQRTNARRFGLKYKQYARLFGHDKEMFSHSQEKLSGYTEAHRFHTAAALSEDRWR